MNKPNILFLVVDCLRADHVYEKGFARTPTLDKLRANGFSFLHTITTDTQTTPSFASMMTARYPFEHGIRSLYGHRLASNVLTMPEMLREAGYHTVAEVSGPLVPETGLGRGFDEYNLRTKDVIIHKEWGEILLEKFRKMSPSPWFMLLHLWEVHGKPRVLPQCDNDECGTTAYARAISSVDVYLARMLEALPKDTLIVITGDHGEMLRSPQDDRKRRKRRKKIFKFLNFLHNHGLTSHHPAHALRDGWGGHGHLLYDELLKVPLVFHGPGIVPHGVSGKQVRHVDIPATILDVAGAASAGLTGRSLMDMIRGGPGEHRDAYSEVAGERYFNKQLALASLRSENRHKYIYAPFNSRVKPELFNLEADPGERNNIIKSRPDIATDLRRKLDAMSVERMPGTEMTDSEKAAALERLKSLGYHDV